MSATFSDSHRLDADAEFSPAKFTVEEYLQMAEHGVFDDVGRIELLEGNLVRAMTKNPPHSVSLGLLNDYLSQNIAGPWFVANQESVRLDDSIPEPDLMIVEGERRDYTDHHPQPRNVALLIEVADTSLRKDRRKGLIYARNRVPIYWIVNLIDEQIEVYEQPVDSGYQTLKTYQRGRSVPCVVAGGMHSAVPVDDILP